jgi:hypothetical protein
MVVSGFEEAGDPIDRTERRRHHQRLQELAALRETRRLLASSLLASWAQPTPQRSERMTVKFVVNDKGNPAGKLADAELHFSGGPLDGLKLVGFAVWERRSGGRNVTFPARQYTVNGERRSFALLRPLGDSTGQDKLRDVILAAYGEHEAALAEAM